jgi:hypothetical protein
MPRRQPRHKESEEEFLGPNSRHRSEGTLSTERRAAVSRHKNSRGNGASNDMENC